MLVELRQSGSDVLLDRLQLDVPPHPGRWVELNGRSYLVMQRRHRYPLRNGRYEIGSVALVVKPQIRPVDAKAWRHVWVIGDPDCRFNAHSPLLRCAVWPDGPCHECQHRESR